MLEPAQTGNSTFPAPLLRTPNESLVFVAFFSITKRKAALLGAQSVHYVDAGGARGWQHRRNHCCCQQHCR